MKIASGGIRHETNTFSVTPTTLADMDWMILWDNVYKEFYGEDISDLCPNRSILRSSFEKIRDH